MAQLMRTKRRRTSTRNVKDCISIQCLVSGLFLSVSLFLLCSCFLNSETMHVSRNGGPAISVGRVVGNSPVDGGSAGRDRRNEPARKMLQQKISSATINNRSKENIVTTEEAVAVFEDFLHELHHRLQGEHEGESNFNIVHSIYHDVAVEKLLPFDEHYLEHMPERRDDDSIFLSIASYRDENCINTITKAYELALKPNNLHVGLVQQNCVKDCRTGVLKNGQVEEAGPDEDCYQIFCDSEIGKPHCDAKRIRVLKVDEAEALGPYTARYFASKLWSGESWFLQIDSHSTFANHWDSASVHMLQKAPSEKPVISHYPPGAEETNFEAEADSPAPRMCEASFEQTECESQIVRLGESKVSVPVEWYNDW